MKKKSVCARWAVLGPSLRGSGIIAGGLLALNVLAAEPPTHEDFRGMQQSVSCIGLEVKDTRGQLLGSVSDLALDLEHGRIVEVIVSSGGFLGFGQRTVAVPPGAFRFEAKVAGLTPTYDLPDTAFRFTAKTGVLRLNIDQQMFKAAPALRLSKWAEHAQSRRVAEVYRYYGQVPYFAADGQGSQSGNTATEPLGYIQRYSQLLGLPVKNLQNKPLGRVFVFLFNPRDRGAVSHVIVMSPELTWSVIPATALRFTAAHDALCLDVSTQAFQNEPRFKFKWMCDPFAPYNPADVSRFEQETYANTKVAANDGVNTRQNVREGTALTYTPLAQGASFADVDITHRIYSAMRADAGLSRNAQNVEVGTLDGRITLRGHVNTETGKRAIGSIAAQVGLPENVSNLLEVRPLLGQ